MCSMKFNVSDFRLKIYAKFNLRKTIYLYQPVILELTKMMSPFCTYSKHIRPFYIKIFNLRIFTSES